MPADADERGPPEPTALDPHAPRSVRAPLPHDAHALRIGGVTPLSATDYPGLLSAVVFCQGCPWRCGYCHNAHLIDARAPGAIAWSDLQAFLLRRAGLLDAVVFSGGEPLAQPALAGAMREVRALGFRVGLHTGGAYPARLAEVLPLVDWVGFDVKADFAAYAAITQVAGSGERARASAMLLLQSGVAHEFRTTVHPDRHDAAGVTALAQRLAGLGVSHYALQAFRGGTCLDDAWSRATNASFLDARYAATIATRFGRFELRA